MERKPIRKVVEGFAMGNGVCELWRSLNRLLSDLLFSH